MIAEFIIIPYRSFRFNNARISQRWIWSYTDR